MTSDKPKSASTDRRTTGPTKLIPPDGGWGWMVVFGTALITGLMPTISYCFGFMYVYFRELGYTHVQISAIPALLVAVSCIPGPFFTGLSKFYSHRKLAIIGVTLEFLGLLSCAFSSNLFYYYFAYSIVAGTGVALGSPQSFLISQKYFLKKRVAANSVGMMGGSVCTIFFPVLLPILKREFGMRGAILIWSAIILNSMIGAFLFQPVEWHSKPQAADEEMNAENASSIPDVSRRDSTGALYKSCNSLASRKSILLEAKFKSIPGSLEDFKEYKSTDNIIATLNPMLATSQTSTENTNTFSPLKDTRDFEYKDLDTLSDEGTEECHSGLCVINNENYKEKAVALDHSKGVSSLAGVESNVSDTRTHSDNQEDDESASYSKNNLQRNHEPSETSENKTVEPFIQQSDKQNSRPIKDNFRTLTLTPTVGSVEFLYTPPPSRPLSMYTPKRALSGEFCSLDRIPIQDKFGSAFSLRTEVLRKRKRQFSVDSSVAEEEEQNWQPELQTAVQQEWEENSIRCCGLRFPRFRDIVNFSILTNPIFLVAAGSSTCMRLVYSCFLTYLPDYGRTNGLEDTEPFLLLSIISVFDLLSKIFHAGIGDRGWIERRFVYMLSAAGVGCSILGTTAAKSFPALAACTAAFGFSVGGAIANGPVLLVEYLGIQLLPLTYGCLLLITGISTLLFYPFSGWLIDVSGGYEIALTVIAGISFGPCLLWGIVNKLAPSNSKPSAS